MQDRRVIVSVVKHINGRGEACLAQSGRAAPAIPQCFKCFSLWSNKTASNDLNISSRCHQELFPCPHLCSVQGLILDTSRYQATLHSHVLDLTVVEFKLLHFLFSNPGQIYSRSQLMHRIYPDERIVSDRTIDSHVKKLRKKITLAAPDQELIHSVYGIGYKFEASKE